MSMEIQQQLDQATLLQYGQSPFQFMGDIQVLDNLRRGSRKVGQSIYKDSVREPLIKHGFALVGALALSGGSKGKLLGDIGEAAVQDKFLEAALEVLCRPLEIRSLMFVQSTQVARLQFIAENYPHLHVDPTKKQGTFTLDEYARYSRIMYMTGKQYLSTFFKKERTDEGMRYVSKDKSVLLRVESSSPTSAPVPPVGKPPILFEGIDRGNTALYDFARDPTTKDATTIIALLRSKDLKDWIFTHRAKYNSETQNPTEVFQEMKHQFTDKDGNKVDAMDLTEKEQRQLLAYLADSTAPPAGIRRSDQEFTDLVYELYHRYDGTRYALASPTDVAFYKFLKDTLSTNIEIVRNDFFQGDNTYHLDHLFGNSLLSIVYPEILPPFARELISKEKLEEGDMIRSQPVSLKNIQPNRRVS